MLSKADFALSFVCKTSCLSDMLLKQPYYNFYLSRTVFLSLTIMSLKILHSSKSQISLYKRQLEFNIFPFHFFTFPGDLILSVFPLGSLISVCSCALSFCVNGGSTLILYPQMFPLKIKDHSSASSRLSQIQGGHHVLALCVDIFQFSVQFYSIFHLMLHSDN